MPEIKTLMRLALAVLVFCLITISLRGKAHAGLLDIPGFDFVIDRVKDHGYGGRAWDIKARPQQTIILTMNDKGPLYVAIGTFEDSITNKWYALGGVQYDVLHLWRSSRKWKPIRKMELVKMPDDWRLLVGPMPNIFRVMPNLLRIDRDVLYNAAIHVPLGRAGKDKKDKKDDG